MILPMTKSPECIAPSAFDTKHRQQSAKVGVFNLISTMIGGGVLSLPFAVSRSGILLGLILLTISAIVSTFSFDILVSASRRTGSVTYQQTAHFAFGEKVSTLITFAILILTYLASVGYCILVGDLLKPVICYIGSISESECTTEWLRRIVIISGILCVSPFCYMREIKALKWTSSGSICAVIILALIITYTTLQSFGTQHYIYYINKSSESIPYLILSNNVSLFPTSFEDTIYVFPVFGIAFMCHFNIPQVHSELTRPTRKRMRSILVSVVIICYIIYSFIAFFGYFYSFNYTCGNILLNYNQNSSLVSIARLCLGFVILFSFPLLILPARNNLHSLLNMILPFKSMNLTMTNSDDIEYIDDEIITTDSDYDSDSVPEEAKLIRINKPIIHKVINISHASKSTSTLLNKKYLLNRKIITYDTFNEPPLAISEQLRNKSKSTTNLLRRPISPKINESFTTRSFSNLDSPLRSPNDLLGAINEPSDVEKLRNADFTQNFGDLENAKDFKPSRLWLIIETTILILLSLSVAFSTSSIMVLWAIVGSTVTFMVAFLLPGLFYFKIRRHKGWRLRNIAALSVAIVAFCAMILCTWQAMVRLDALPCPTIPSHT